MEQCVASVDTFGAASKNSLATGDLVLVAMKNPKVLASIALLLGLFVGPITAQTVTTFEGIDASQLGHPEFDVDPNGAIGTKQLIKEKMRKKEKKLRD